MDLISLDESQSADANMAEAMESDFMNLKELDNTLNEQDTFLVYAETFTHYLDELSFYAIQHETSDDLLDNYIETFTKYCDEQYLFGVSENKINLFEDSTNLQCSHC
jgi:hypothetical protein